MARARGIGWHDIVPAGSRECIKSHMKTSCFALLLLLLPAPLLSQVRGMDASASTVTVRVFKSGLFAAFAHDHTVSASIASGNLDIEKRSIRLSFRAREMKIVDKDVSESDRSTIEHTMKSEVLDVEKFPEIAFQSTSVEPAGSGRFDVRGDLTLHGKTVPIKMAVSLPGGHYSGSAKLKQTDYGITPVRIAGGTVRVKDEIEVIFEITPAK